MEVVCREENVHEVLFDTGPFTHFFVVISFHLHNSVAFRCNYETIASVILSASAFCNYLLREDFDCSFPGSRRNHTDLL